MNGQRHGDTQGYKYAGKVNRETIRESQGRMGDSRTQGLIETGKETTVS